MNRTRFPVTVAVAAAVSLLGLAMGGGAAAQTPAGDPPTDLPIPRVHLELAGPMRTRVEAIIHHWLVPAPDANPGMLEMMRLRDRKPPYEDPVPWAGEFVGKYLTSCVLVGRLSNDPALREVTARVMRDLIRTQAEDGYLGPFPDQHLLGRWDLWGHYHCLLAMCLWHQDTGDAEALRSATRAADLMVATFLGTGHRVHDAGSQEMNMAVIHALGLLYRETRKDAYLRLMREIELDWQKPPAGDYHRLALTGIEFYQTPKPRWESLHPMLGLAELFRITREDSYRQALLHWWRSIYRTDVHNSGSFSTSEQAVGNPFQSGAIETCCTVAWMTLSVEALRLTGDSRIADVLEHATWNAALGHEHPSGRWCTYDTPMDGKRLASAHSIVFQARPGTPELNCCSVNGPNGLGLISQWAVLGGKSGLYLNYFGAGRSEVRLEDGSAWTFTQVTDYPRDGALTIQVQPPRPTSLPLLVRIPEWSIHTRVRLNDAPVDGVRAGAYLRLERTWSPGDQISLDLDLRPRALRGDHHVRFDTSLLRGPVLLTFDQKHNAMDPDQMPALDLASLTLEPLPGEDPVRQPGPLQPMVAVAVRAVGGERVVLCDFGSAGAHGTAYRSWLPVRNAPTAPFQLQHPEAGAALPLEDVPFAWNPAEPGSTYTLRVATDSEFKNVLLTATNLVGREFRWPAPANSGARYYWQVESRLGERQGGAVNGPLSFTVDATVPTSSKGVVVRAALAGVPTPEEGRVQTAEQVLAAVGRDGTERGAIAFDGSSTKLVYEAPQFPLRTYTFAAWFRPQGLTDDGRRWHHIVSAWWAPANDPLRVSVQNRELVLSIEQPQGGVRLSGGRVEDGQWYHIAVVKQFTEVRLYVNGKIVGRATAAPSFQPGARNLGVGGNPNYGDLEGFRGALADVIFRREALADADIRKLAGAP